ncbi:mitogen-activated kinase kinase kinase kinase 4-like protein [Labeo rohita]|uniref:Mitogen-activated kinase kinase kinase kinase 4-like protein n=1 Tax=Labeo rohita TaxID=84645 RepID=A0A498MM62_LABRO|nr:mitogen-activated kinase kinase kinase kinase 4-like protein [Labeo rohita]
MGRAHAEAALGGSDCPHCGDMSLRTLRLRVAIIQGDELAQLALPRSSSAASLEPRSKVTRASDVDLSGSDMVSFGAMENAEEGDDAISVAASEREEWSNSPLEYTAPHSSDAGDLHHGDVELLRVLTKAVKELGLVWALPAEPTRSRLDEWYLQSDHGRKDTPRRPGPFFPEVHDEIAKSCNALLTSRVHNPECSLLSSVDGADRAGYAKLPPCEQRKLRTHSLSSDEIRAAYLSGFD